jgi:lysine biosynthesis protein LysW
MIYMSSKQCPNCSSRLAPGENPRVGQVIVCGNCGVKLEILWLLPLEYGVVNPLPPKRVNEKTAGT